MSWVRLDDRFPTHPKVVGLTAEAFRLHVEGLCYCAEHLTDGWIPSGFRVDTAETSPVTRELIAAGLWSLTDNGWEIHDYLDWNPPRAKVTEKRERDRARQEKGRMSRWNPHGIAAESHGPVPVPVPPITKGFTVAVTEAVDRPEEKIVTEVSEDKADAQAVALALAAGRDLLKDTHPRRATTEDQPT